MASVADLEAVEAKVDANEAADNTYWLLWGGALVFSMQCGFCMLEVGTVRIKNTKNILVKNILDACIGCIMYWAFGYGLSYGMQKDTSANTASFAGNDLFFYSGEPGKHQFDHDDGYGTLAGSYNFAGYAHFFFNYTFAATAASIVSGAVAERCGMWAYFLYSAVLSGFVYPVVAHWVWAQPGWMCAWNTYEGKSDPLNDVGVVDFAGSGVVHLTGAVAALCGAFWLGPRRGRFDETTGEPLEMPSHSATMQVLGTFFLWIGWYGFNCGTAFTFAYSAYAFAAGRIAVTTTIAAASCAITSMGIAYAKKPGEFDLGAINNGALGGLVSITAGCATVAPYSAFIIGILGGFVYHAGSWLMLKCKIDDVVDAIAVHGFCGIWGCIAVGLFSRNAELVEVYAIDEAGAFEGGDGKLLGTAIALVVCVCAWVGTLMFIFFAGCHYAGILRVSEKEEEDGLDASHHGGPAYNAGDVDIELAAKLATTDPDAADGAVVEK